MLSGSKLLLVFNNLKHAPLPPKRQFRSHKRFTSMYTIPYGRMFWRRAVDPEFSRQSWWVSDFKHKFLALNGYDYTGAVPNSPQPGFYQMQNNAFFTKRIGNHPKPSRESRHLPIHPLSPRIVYEFRKEKRDEFINQYRQDRRTLAKMREQEFFEWYMKVQRVRGRWCRENNVTSRGIYGPAVDAAEIWG